MEKTASNPWESAEVLIVEDDPAIRRLMIMTFKRAGLRAAAVEDGAGAIAALDKAAFRVLLLDLMMPRVTGWDVIDWLKAHPAHKPRSVVVVSAGNRDVLRELDPSVVNAIVFKPVDVTELTAYVTACCSNPAKRDRRVKRLVTSV